MKQLIVNHEKLQTRVALVEDGRLEEYYIERNDEPRIVGSIYKGRIRNLEPSLQAAFVDIGLEKNAFLHYWDMIPASLDRLEEDDDDENESSGFAVNAADDSDDDSDDDDSDDSDDSGDNGDSKSEGNGDGERRGRRRRGRRRGGRGRNRRSDDRDNNDGNDNADNANGNDAKAGDAKTGDNAGDAPTTSERRESATDAQEKPQPPKAVKSDKPTPSPRAAEAVSTPPQKAVKAPEPPASAPVPVAPSAAAPAKDDAPIARQSLSLTQKLKNLFSGSRERAASPSSSAAPSVAEKPAAPAQQAPREDAPARNGKADSPDKAAANGKNDAKNDSNGKGGQDTRDEDRSDESSNDGDGDERRGRRRRRGGRNNNRDNREKSDSDKGGDDNEKSNDRGRDRKGRSGGGGGGKRRRQARNVNIDDIPKQFAVNSEVTVQVTKGMIGEKGPRVTTNLSMPGRYTVLLPNSDHRGVSRRIEDRKERTRLREVVRSIDLPKNMGLICRTAGIGLSDEAIRLDVELLMEKWTEAERLTATRRAPVCTYAEPSLLERTIRDFLSEGIDEIVIDTKEAHETAMSYINRLPKENRPRLKFYDHPTPIFVRYRLRDQIDHIFRRKVALASGAELCIDETEALIAIDINSGRSRGGKDHPETILNTNLEAAEEVARQLRLRNIGGLVVVDFIDMRSRRDQLAVYRKMLDSLARDRAKTKIMPLSKLGLMEMTRQREHESLQDTVFETCQYCSGRGIVKSATSISVEIQRRLQEILRRDRRAPIRVVVHPRVLDRLKTSDANILRNMEVEYGGDLSFRSDPNIHQESFHLIDTSTGKEI